MRLRISSCRAPSRSFFFERRHDAGAQQRCIERLEKEILGTELDAACHRLELVKGRNDDDRRVADLTALPERLQHLKSVHIRHHDVEQDEIETALVERLQRISAARSLLDLGETELLQPAREKVTVVRDVVNNENGHVTIELGLAPPNRAALADYKQACTTQQLRCMAMSVHGDRTIFQSLAFSRHVVRQSLHRWGSCPEEEECRCTNLSRSECFSDDPGHR
jgi:hypothetical protein